MPNFKLFIIITMGGDSMERQELDRLIFCIEKLLLNAEALNNYVGTPESFSTAFYSLLDDVQSMGEIYNNLETPLRDLA